MIPYPPKGFGSVNPLWHFAVVDRNLLLRNLTFLLVHVLHISHPAALEGTTCYAREIVDNFFRNIGVDVLY
jgi:hypothetical protein